MKALILTLLLLSFPTLSYSHNWILIGPDTVAVNNAYTSYSADVLLISDGILVNEWSGWVKYSIGNLPVWDLVEIDPDTLIVVMGDGSYSDGIYTFTFGNSQFQILEWCIYPNFIVRNSLINYYFVGHQNGLLKSTNGSEWEEVEFFQNKNCLAMDFFNEYSVISVSGDTNGIYYSLDGGNSWLLSQSMSHYLEDLIFDNSGLLYGIFPDESWSSGLWKSEDYGATWDVEFYSTNMSSIGYTANRLFVGWYDSDFNQNGIAIWDALSQILTFLNDGLANTNIRSIVENQFFDCPNITVCTDSGAYCLTEFPVGIEDGNIIPSTFNLKNYPNPFNSETTFFFELPNRTFIEFTIYDIFGQKVVNLFSGFMNSGIHKINWNANNLASGLYIYRLKSERINRSGKCILAK
ncbi:MAG: T9SS type A sorting domain-containing protein [Calditrichia bacterium]|nr:T9SS type A sorting domain-containing protein [Calditrichia bacterium]